MLAPVVSVANIVQEVKAGTNTADSDLNPSVQLSPSAHGAALTPHAAAGTGFASGRFLTSAAWLPNQQQSGRRLPRCCSPKTMADRTISLAKRFPTARWLTA